MMKRQRKNELMKRLYQEYINISPTRCSSKSLSEVGPKNISHDSYSNFLKKKKITPKEVWDRASYFINKDTSGTIIIDDTIIDKRHSKNIDIVNLQYSGNEKRVINGIGLINCMYKAHVEKLEVPIDFRIYDKKSDGKNKNNHFKDMINTALQRKVKIENVVMDGWYSAISNLHLINRLKLRWVTRIKKNRIINRNQHLEDLKIPDEGLIVHLRGYGWIKVFKFEAKNSHIEYVATNYLEASREYVSTIKAYRWSIETFHRELKQTCNIGSCQSRTGRAQRNFICLSILSWFDKFTVKTLNSLSLYQQNWNFIKDTISKHLSSYFKKNLLHLSL